MICEASDDVIKRKAIKQQCFGSTHVMHVLGEATALLWNISAVCLFFWFRPCLFFWPRSKRFIHPFICFFLLCMVLLGLYTVDLLIHCCSFAVILLRRSAWPIFSNILMRIFDTVMWLLIFAKKRTFLTYFLEIFIRFWSKRGLTRYYVIIFVAFWGGWLMFLLCLWSARQIIL